MATSKSNIVSPKVDSFSRRQFLLGAGALGLSAAAYSALATAIADAPGRAKAYAATQTLAPKPEQVFQPIPFPDTVQARIGHLFRRAGFGITKQELAHFTSIGVDGAVDYLVEYQETDNRAVDFRLSALPVDMTRQQDMAQWWMLRMAYTQRPLEEKMTLFWHGLLTSSFAKAGQGMAMYDQNQMFRAHALDTYDVILKALARDPAMLIYLDNRLNRRQAPNENFARELMELFTLGRGNYTEQDIRESARAFTGWGLDRDRKFLFMPQQHDSGVKTFLGRTGALNGDDIIDVILQQPAAARYIAGRLFSFFAYRDPSPKLLDRLAATFTATRYSIKAVVREIFYSEEFFSDQAYRALVKSPIELVVGMWRQTGLDGDGRSLSGMASSMGQTILNPPNVAGWAGGAAWINSTTLLQRVNHAFNLSNQFAQRALRDPQSAASLLLAATPEQLVDTLAAQLLDGNLPRDERTILVQFVRNLDSAGGSSARRNPDRVGSVLYLLLASPDYQLA